MSGASQFLANHGLPLVFAAVFLEQMGLPLPAVPWLLAAGALPPLDGLTSCWGSQVPSSPASLPMPSGFIWDDIAATRCWDCSAAFLWTGLMCAANLKCLYALRNERRDRGKIPAWHEHDYTTIGRNVWYQGWPLSSIRWIGIISLLWCFFILGYFFSSQITQTGVAMAHLGSGVLGLLVAFLALYVAYKYWQRQRLLHELRMARITVEELRQKLDAGENPVILDLRAKAELELDPSIVRGAIHMEVDKIENHSHEIPRDRDIILYCSCPNEVTSTRVALKLHRKGISRVRPLLG